MRPTAISVQLCMTLSFHYCWQTVSNTKVTVVSVLSHSAYESEGSNLWESERSGIVRSLYELSEGLETNLPNLKCSSTAV